MQSWLCSPEPITLQKKILEVDDTASNYLVYNPDLHDLFGSVMKKVEGLYKNLFLGQMQMYVHYHSDSLRAE